MAIPATMFVPSSPFDINGAFPGRALRGPLTRAASFSLFAGTVPSVGPGSWGRAFLESAPREAAQVRGFVLNRGEQPRRTVISSLHTAPFRHIPSRRIRKSRTKNPRSRRTPSPRRREPPHVESSPACPHLALSPDVLIHPPPSRSLPPRHPAQMPELSGRALGRRDVGHGLLDQQHGPTEQPHGPLARFLQTPIPATSAFFAYIRRPHEPRGWGGSARWSASVAQQAGSPGRARTRAATPRHATAGALPPDEMDKRIISHYERGLTTTVSGEK